MGLYQHIAKIWKQPNKNLGQVWHERLIRWRREPTTLRLDRPTRLDRARSLGYKAKQGVFVVRQRVVRGGHIRPRPLSRKPKKMTIRLALRKNYQLIAEERANKHYPNCEVLNSYNVGSDGTYYWYEIILVDRDHPAVKADNVLSLIAKQKGRVFRGLTSAGKRSRGLYWKGKGVEKARPSRRANKRLQ